MSLLLIHFPAPFGWVALTPEQLAAARTLAEPLLPEMDEPKQSTDKTPRQLFDATEAARVLKVDPSWLLRAARERRIPFVRMGKYVRFDPDELISLFHVTPTTGPSDGYGA